MAELIVADPWSIQPIQRPMLYIPAEGDRVVTVLDRAVEPGFSIYVACFRVDGQWKRAAVQKPHGKWTTFLSVLDTGSPGTVRLAHFGAEGGHIIELLRRIPQLRGSMWRVFRRESSSPTSGDQWELMGPRHGGDELPEPFDYPNLPDLMPQDVTPLHPADLPPERSHSIPAHRDYQPPGEKSPAPMAPPLGQRKLR